MNPRSPVVICRQVERAAPIEGEIIEDAPRSRVVREPMFGFTCEICRAKCEALQSEFREIGRSMPPQWIVRCPGCRNLTKCFPTELLRMAACRMADDLGPQGVADMLRRRL